MKKFCVFSGFLGSGKTTAMMALTKYCTEHHCRSAMISNDLGSQSLADNRLADLSGCSAVEITGGCICYQRENLAHRLDSLFDTEGCGLVISDIPGFGVGALDHVYHGLAKDYGERYSLSPFTVLVEKRSVDALRAGGGDIGYILNTQLVEADLIVLSKCDLLSAGEREEALAWLRESYPQAEVLAISALSGEGLEELTLRLLRGSASMRLPDIGYGGPEFGDAMGRICEYYLQYYAAVCCGTADGSAYLLSLAEAVRSRVAAAGYDIPHLKLLAWTEDGDYGKADLIGVDRPVELSHGFAAPCTEFSVMLNASAICPAVELDGIMAGAVEDVSRAHDLDVMYFRHECFGMG